MKKNYFVSASVTKASGFILGQMAGVQVSGLLSIEGDETTFESGKGPVTVSGKITRVLQDADPAFPSYVGKELSPQTVLLDGSWTLSLSGNESFINWEANVVMNKDWKLAKATVAAKGWLNNINVSVTASIKE